MITTLSSGLNQRTIASCSTSRVCIRYSIKALTIEKQFDTFELQDDEDRFIVMDTDWGLALGAINIDRSCIRMLMWINPITLTRI